MAFLYPAEKGSRPASRGADSDLDDESSKSFSTASQRSFGGRNGSSVWEAELEEIEDDPFHENVEKLYEKRWVLWRRMPAAAVC